MTTAQATSTQCQPAPRAVPINRFQSIRRTGWEKSTTRAQQGAQSPSIPENQSRNKAGERPAKRRFQRSRPAKFIDRPNFSSSESASARIMALSARSVRRIRRTARPLRDFTDTMGTGPFINPVDTVDTVDTIDTVGKAASGSARSRIITASDALCSSHD